MRNCTLVEIIIGRCLPPSWQYQFILFSVIDSATNTVHSAVVFSNYTINDFQIVGDTAYCGGSDGSNAIIACLDLNGIQTSSSASFDVIVINNIDQVTKLAAYRNYDMNGIGIAAIGMDPRSKVSYDKYYMIECNNFGGSPFSATSRQCRIETYPTLKVETLCDVVVTKNYVGFVGLIANTNQVCIRRGDKNGIFASSLIDTVHRYCYPSTTIQSLPVAESLDADAIAVAAAYKDIYPSTTVCSAQIFLFDLFNMDFFDAWETYPSDIEAVIELVYVPSPRILLMAAESTTSTYHVIYTYPFSPVDYYAPFMTPSLPSEKICSMDFRNSSYYILSTYDHWMLQKLVYPCSASNRCIETNQMWFFHQLVSLDNPVYHKVFWRSSTPYHDKFFPTHFVYSIDCFSN